MTRTTRFAASSSAIAYVFAANVFAQTTPAAEPPKAEAKAPEPDYTLTGNFGIYSQYIFRGLTQTDTRPAAQG
ncbi:MAG TPA: TorF family putative porin, partial [Casimicrobiaceae bacterium]|nr:TorF family putative porin [Casimicrobiaceae bacterium]